MKIKLSKLSYVLFIAILSVSLSLVTFASADTKPTASDNNNYTSLADEIPENEEDIVDYNVETANPKEVDSESVTGENTMEQENPVKAKNSNAPLFIGAGISVIMFIGVVIFCKIKGNR